jgi:phosphoglycolate phosphatase
MSPRGLAIFDLDGTLFRADIVTVPAVQGAFKAHGLPAPSEDAIRSFIGRTTPELRAWLNSLAGPALGARVAEEADRREVALVTEAGELYAGVPEVLRTLRAQAVALAICTNGPRHYVDAVVDGYGLRPFFDAIRHLQADGDTKASMIRELLDRLAARPAVMVGDRPIDVDAAHANGLPAIGVTYGMCHADELSAADALAHAPCELPGLIARLIAGPARTATEGERRR